VQAAVLTTLVSILLVAGAAKADTLYAIDWKGNLYTIDPGSAETTFLADTGIYSQPFGLADYGERLFTYDVDVRLFTELDPVSGGIIDQRHVRKSIGGEGSAAIRADGLAVLAKHSGHFYTLDFTDPTATTVQRSRLPQLPDGTWLGMDGLDYSPTGALFGKSHTHTGLYGIKEFGSDATLIADLPDDTEDIFRKGFSGLTFRSDGTLWVENEHMLYTIDLTSGAMTLVGSMETEATITGLTWLGTETPIPEPSSLWLLGVGAIGLVWVRRRRSRAR
jgi:hypothetical protein